jgi:hypothetical protein
MICLDFNEIEDVPTSSIQEVEKKIQPKISTIMNENYILYGSIQNTTNIKQKIKTYLSKYCDINITLKSITVKNNYYKIPELYCTGHKQKAIAENLNLIYPKTLNSNIYKTPPELPPITETSKCIELVHIKNQTYYNTKKQAIDDSINHPNKNLFSGDLTLNTGCKRFYLLTYEYLWNIIKSNNQLHYYENYEENQPLRLFIDIDYKIKSTNRISYDELLDQVMETIDEHLESYNIKDSEKIILSSNRQDKNSAHIIYPKVYFKSITHMKIFMMDIKSPLITNKIIDPSVYKVGCFRLYLNSKKGINIPLVYYKGINYKYKNTKTVFYDTLLRNINSKEEDYVPITIQENIQIKNKQPNTIRDIQTGHNKTVNIETLRKYLFLLGKEHGKHYMDWRKIGIIIHNCNSTEEGFNLWDSWSKQFTSYGGRDICAREWNKFKSGPMGLGTLRKFAKEANPIEYSKICNIKELVKFESIKYCKEYNLDRIDNEYEKIKDNLTIVTKNMNCWFTGEYKTLAIKAPYGTGKTTLIGSILTEYNPKRILFVSYRQSLSNSLYGTFKKYRFKNYLDKFYNANRLICQLESLKNIEINADYMFDNTIEVPSYDLVIMDEIESMLSHFESPTVTDKEYTFDLLTGICNNSKKILALDGDFGNRGYDFINNHGNSLVLENTIKKNVCRYLFTNNMRYFESDIDDKLTNKKKIVIISMTSKMSEHYYNKYKMTYDCIIHNSHTDDTIKAKLQNVENYWNNCQLLVYTPSVEAGVNFDIDYFDYKYVSLSEKSCSPRGLCQMINRVRKTTNSTILLYLGKLPYYENIGLYTYDEVELYIRELHNKYIKPNIIHNNKTNKFCLEYMESPYTKLTIYNELEKLNKQRNYFVAQLIVLLKNKGHTCKLLDDDICVNLKIKNYHFYDILYAEDLNTEEYDILLKKQEGGYATKEDKCAIEKHLYKVFFGIDELDKDFMIKYYGQIHILKNLKYILGDEVNIDETLQNTNSKVAFWNIKKVETVSIIKDIVSKLGFDINKINCVTINKNTFEKNIKHCKEQIKLFTEPNKYRPLFDLNKCTKDTLNSTKAFLGFINNIFKEWGLFIHSSKTTKKINNKKVSHTKYKLRYYKNMNLFLSNK